MPYIWILVAAVISMSCTSGHITDRISEYSATVLSRSYQISLCLFSREARVYPEPQRFGVYTRALCQSKLGAGHGFLLVRGEKKKAGEGKLTGKVTRGPMWPEVRGKDIPPSEPASGVKLMILTMTGEEFRSMVTDERGEYSISLPPGTYRIEMAPPVKGFTSDLPATVTITEGEETHLNIDIETGIR